MGGREAVLDSRRPVVVFRGLLVSRHHRVFLGHHYDQEYREVLAVRAGSNFRILVPGVLQLSQSG
jgi:hypothetical protein